MSNNSQGIISLVQSVCLRPLVTAADINLGVPYDVGNGHTIKYIFASKDLFPTDSRILDIGNGKAIIGMIWEHDALLHEGEPPRRCHGEILFVGEKGVSSQADIWKLEKLVPISISPSLNCYTCYSHGFLRDGYYDEIGVPNKYGNYMKDPAAELLEQMKKQQSSQGAISVTQLRLN